MKRPSSTPPEQLSLPLWSDTSGEEPHNEPESNSAANLVPSDETAGETPTASGNEEVPSPPLDEPAPGATVSAPDPDTPAPREAAPVAPTAAGRPARRLSDFVPRFIEFSAAIDRSPHTLKTTQIDLSLLTRFLDDAPATDVDLESLRRFAAWLRIERKNDPRSLRRKVASVKAFFAYLTQIGVRSDDPAVGLVYPTPEPHLPEFLESHEVDRLILAAERPLWRAVIITILDAGLKRDEILALHSADVYLDPTDPDRSYLTIRATNQARRIRARVLPLTSRLVAELARQIDTGASDRVFPISVRAVNMIVETTGKRAGIRKRGTISPQMLRDTFAIREVRRRMLEEEREREAGRSEHEVALLRQRHDQEVCDLLGLNPGETNDPIARYRILAMAGQSFSHSPGNPT